MAVKKITRVVKTYRYTAVKLGEDFQLQEKKDFFSLAPLSETQKSNKAADMGFTFVAPGVSIEKKRYIVPLEAFIQAATKITEV